MNRKIEILHENRDAGQCEVPFNSPCFSGSVQEVNQSEAEESVVKANVNLDDDSMEGSADFLNDRDSPVFSIKVVNTSDRLSEVPKMLCSFKYLSVLNLSNNSLEILPCEIGNLCNLTVLNLSRNRLHFLPRSLKHVQQLKYLDISNNKFSEVPEVLYYGLRALKVLDVSCNEIKSFNDSPGCLSKLTVLRMTNNLLEELPLWVFDSLCQLEFLSIAENQLHLNVEPLQYCTAGIFESLHLLNAENCNLTYENIQILSLFKSLNVLQIGNKACLNGKSRGRNYLGNLKGDVFKNSREIKYLSLRNAQIATLPSEFDCLKHVEVLDLSDNLLSWLPECICNLIYLKVINLTSNQLLFLPSNIGELFNLKEIHVGNNKLYDIPNSFCNLTNLEYLDLYNNQIEKIDLKILTQSHLKGIDLGLNCINFAVYGSTVDVNEVTLLYNTKKDLFRQRFCNAGSRSDFQKVKLDGEPDEKSSDSRSHMSSYESGSLSDCDDPLVNIDLKSYDEDEKWEETDPSQNRKDELFDPNEAQKFDQRQDFWSLNFRKNYCPANYHLPSVTKAYIRNREVGTVDDGQFDSD